jgi:hypothetical protein
MNAIIKNNCIAFMLLLFCAVVNAQVVQDSIEIDSAKFYSPIQMRTTQVVCDNLPNSLNSTFSTTTNCPDNASGCNYPVSSCNTDGWFSVFGTPAISPSSTTNANNGFMVMVADDKEGESPAVCFNFLKDKTYLISLDVRLQNGLWGGFATHFDLYATSYLYPRPRSQLTNILPIVTGPDCQEDIFNASNYLAEHIGLINQIGVSYTDYTPYCFLYTPTQDYTQFWLVLKSSSAAQVNINVDNVKIEETTSNPITITGTPITCGSATTLTASGGTTYAWSNGPTTAQNTVTNSGIYTVTATTTAGCTATASYATTITPLPAPVLTVFQPSCAQAQNGEIYVGAHYDQNLTYAWGDLSGPFADTTGTTSGVLQGLDAGTYTVTITTASGCTATASASIIAPTNNCFTCDKTNAPREVGNWDFEKNCVSTAPIVDIYYIWHNYTQTTTCPYITKACNAPDNSAWFTVFGTPNIVSVTASADDPQTNAMELRADFNWFKRGQKVEGESFAQCFRFEKNVSYRVCCRMRRDMPDNAVNKVRKATLFMYAANNVYESTPKHCIEVFDPVKITEKQLVFAEDVNSMTYSNTTEWKYLTTTFTPTQDFGEVWVYLSYIEGWPSLAYIDDIRIFPTSSGKCCEEKDCIASLRPIPSKKYVVSAWVRESYSPENEPIAFNSPQITLGFNHQTAIGLPPPPPATFSFKATGPIIEGWQRVWGEFTVPEDAIDVQIVLENTAKSPNNEVFFDDIRILPYDGKLKSFVYDPVTLRLVAEMDENNYGTFYEYDKSGMLERVKRETERGVKTIKEARSGSVKK